MSDWRAGYVDGIDYTYGNYLELNPIRSKLAFLYAGLVPPEIGTACELGFGQGLSINLNAAATAVKWHGTDFDPAMAGRARDMAQAANAGAELHDQSFAEFAERTDLPDFDFIGLHGIWTWISNENRATIVDFIRRKLKVGGVLYISYNTLPGWAAFAPVRHLMAQHGSRMGSPGAGILNRMDGAFDFMDKLAAANPRYALAQSSLAERLAGVRKMDKHYVAHEYFNENFDPMYFSDMTRWLAPAKLEFACSAQYADHVDSLILTPEQIELLGSIPDANFREGVRDFILNRQFRRDYWVKGARRLSFMEQAERLKTLRLVLVAPRPSGPLKTVTELGEVALNEDLYGPILDALADRKPRTIGQIDLAARRAGIDSARLMQAIMFLTGKGIIAEAQDDAATKKAWPACERLNSHIIAQSRWSENLQHLASPVTGTGIGISRTDQLFLLALDNRGETPEELAQFAWKALKANGHAMVKDGKPLETADEHIAELTVLAQTFLDRTLPIMTALQIA